MLILFSRSFSLIFLLSFTYFSFICLLLFGFVFLFLSFFLLLFFFFFFPDCFLFLLNLLQDTCRAGMVTTTMMPSGSVRPTFPLFSSSQTAAYTESFPFLPMRVFVAVFGSFVPPLTYVARGILSIVVDYLGHGLVGVRP